MADALLSELRRVTGRLAASSDTPAGELRSFERSLAEHLRANPNLTIYGSRFAHEGPDDFGVEEDLSQSPAGLFEDLPGPAPGIVDQEMPILIYRRETAFRSHLLGNSIPPWAAGTEPSASFGPFVDEYGLRVWYDFFRPISQASLYFSGSAAPFLRVSIWGTIAGRKSYRIEAGSAWIASELIAHVPAVQGYYTGLKVAGGMIELSHAATVSGGHIAVGTTTTVSLHLELHQPSVAHAVRAAGADASAAVVQLPKTFDLHFQLQGGHVAVGPASCTVFGCAADFKHAGKAPLWMAALNQILIPMGAATRSDAPGQFKVASSQSELCTVDGQAAIDTALTGWLLPATKADPLTLGAAAGVGALCLTVKTGLSAVWKGLRGAKTKLHHPAIVVEPGLVTIVDFTAANVNGRQRWTLWRNANNTHASQVTLRFGKLFPFVFVSSVANSEGVFCFCGLKAEIDRPVDANGKPFAVQSSIAFAAILQTGATFRALLLDDDLLFDGNPNAPPSDQQYPLALRNGLFLVSAPRRFALFGDLKDDRITKGWLALTHDVRLYLPTLPDPYVASFTWKLRDPASIGIGSPQQALTGFVKWPNPAPAAHDLSPADGPRALVYYKFTPVIQPIVAAESKGADFQIGVSTFNQELLRGALAGPATMRLESPSLTSLTSNAATFRSRDVAANVTQMFRSAEVRAAVAELDENPLLSHISDKSAHVNLMLEAALRLAPSASSAQLLAASGQTDAPALSVRTFLGQDPLMLLDVSSHADQMGVTVGPALQVDRNARGDHNIQATGSLLTALSATGTGLPLQIMNMDVVTASGNLRAATLPQVSWEPLFNIPLAIEGPVDPADTITVAPGLVVYENDGLPMRIFSETKFPVPIAPLQVARHFLKEFNDPAAPRQLRSLFTLPFAMLAQADFNRSPANPADKNARLGFNMPSFGQLRGGLQIKAQAPSSSTPARVSPTFPGWTFQLDNIRWLFFGLPLTGSTLGKTVREIFNRKFQPGGEGPAVPLEQIEFSGYGATLFSDWRNADAAVADVSQTQFDVIVGRTAHEVVQVRSILYPFGVHVVRTITLMRSNNGYVFRSDSGWKAESDGFYDFSYTVNLQELGEKFVPNPYAFHTQPVKGVSRVREIRDFPAGGPFTSSFKLNDPDLPPVVKALTLAEWQKLFASASSLNHTLDVLLEAVVFDADVHLDNVVSGGTSAGGDFVVQSRKMLGYVQLAPSAIVLPDRVFAELLQFQNGSLGGPVDCTIDVGNSRQRMRVSRVDVNPALNSGGKHTFVTAARGSLILPGDGSWSVVRQRTDTGDVTPVPPGEGVPLIKPNGNPNFLLAHPADVDVPTSHTHYGVLQSTGTQKLLFDGPQFSPGVTRLKSAQTYFADAYKLLNSKGVFPNVANALGLTSAEREVEILGEGLMKLADRTLQLDVLLPTNFQYPFIDEPGVLKIYAEYKNIDKTTGTRTGGQLALGIDSAAAQLTGRWKAAVSNMRVVVDLGPFTELMWVDGHFHAGSGVDAAYNKPHLQFGPVLDPVVQILQVLATLAGDDFDRGMDVGMSNSTDNWEYKFNCSKEIPVIKFPSPEELTLNPNPPLKLEAGLKVGFYFNEVLSIPTDLKQLVPACGAYVEFYGRLEVQCFTLAVASVYGVGQVTLGIAADSKAGITLHMKFGFGVEIVVGLPVVANVSVLYMVEVEVTINDKLLDVAGLMLFRGTAEICGGLVAICIQIEAGGSVHRENDATSLTAQVTFAIDVCLLWIIDIDVTEHWQEQRQIA